MKNRAFVLGAMLFLVNVILDVWMYANGLAVLGILLCIGTILVFSSGIIWLIYQGDRKLHFRRGWFVLPLGIFGAGIARVFVHGPVTFMSTPEDLQAVGSLILSRYQIGLWLTSMILFFVFIMAGSLMMRRRA